MIKQLNIVIKDTLRANFKSRGYWILVLSPLIFVAVIGGVAFGVTQLQGNTTPTVAIIGQASERVPFVQSAKNLDMKISKITNEKQADKALKSEKLGGVLTLKSDSATLTTQPKSDQVPKDDIATILNQLSQAKKATQYGLTAAQTADFMKPVNFKTVVQQANQSESGDNTEGANYAIAVAIGVITMIVVMWYTSMIANAIANEKSSRIMEILLAATSARIQYFGKLIGVFLLALTHMLIYLIAGFATVIFLKDNVFVKMITSNLSGVTTGFMLYALAFILIAVALYLVLTAMVASLINDNAQVQQAIQPISFLAMIGYMFSYFMTFMPNNIAIRALSYVPFVSQSMMPVRLVTHVEGWPTALASLGISFVALILLAWFGQGIYAKNVLSYSDEPIMKQITGRFFRK
ncbi:sodium ABC transporter permease [Leuconostoc pseudomesenteroides]|uniref:Sodium ABC transporter permease n=1 Tax=Leuconostoc pseudomesenteroides TaxID=33968 RepID=A0A1X0VDQ9_LEUPS|nr:ABC transporter permease [Leuconostoc pseudomesenteroides]OQJ72204.1 sodium ABC transporter permease [Leuconostoc pseudomesenteroides]OQJ76621.1 sodium ABC transporter permease [Leuconostoc pseudomesenteroides]OQJ77579.1 sodium ABC transporter permease [Leuconostoc pseudomesenteroides]ORI37228.1 sodium ABC transporter permease [Leuconostoc pseudomesenteroides]ORI45831.1 sodium ABC transporter permease [Leuconostoc pseudomesenteroides]